MRSTVNTCGAAKETERFGAGREVGMHMVCGLWCDGCGELAEIEIVRPRGIREKTW